MVAAIEQATASAEARAHFVAQAEAARKDTLDTGKGYDAAAVHDYLRDRIAGKRTARPKARQWRG
jgi:hypothetical protein